MVCLVILDAIFVLAELLIDLSVIKLEHDHIAPEVRDRLVHISVSNKDLCVKPVSDPRVCRCSTT